MHSPHDLWFARIIRVVARSRAAISGVDATFVCADLKRLDRAGIQGAFDLLLDLRCYHTMSQRERGQYVRSITRVAVTLPPFLIQSELESRHG